jgi:hypothetical protein
LSVEHLGSGVRREAKDFAARDSSKASSAVDEAKAERLDTRDPIGIGGFARARLGGGQGRMQLKAAEQVVGKDRALRPGALSAVVIGGNDHEGEFTFELSEGLLLRPAAGREVPEHRWGERELGGDRGVFKVAVVGRKELELVILRALVMNALAVADHSQIERPRRKLKLGLAAAELGRDCGPRLLGSAQGLDSGPLAAGSLRA